MQLIDLQQTADFLETAIIEHTRDEGHCIVHFGTSEAGVKFVMVNDCEGNTALVQSM